MMEPLIQDPGALLGSAIQHHQAGRLDQAEALYRQLLELLPGQPDAQHLLGVIAFQVGDHQRAVALIEGAIASQPFNPDSHLNLGNVYRALQDLERASAEYRQALDLAPDHLGAHINLGAVLREQGDFQAAAAVCQRALTLDPTSVEALTNLGNALQSLDQLDQAIDCFERALGLLPSSAELANNLGNARRERGDLAAAEQSLRRAVALHPDYADAHNNLGNVLRDRGQLDEAAFSYGEALARDPDHAEAHSNLGVISFLEGDLAGAEAAFEHATILKPRFAQAHSNLGALQRIDGRLDQARQTLLQALELDPRLASAANNLGNVFKDQGLIAEAVQRYQQAVTLRPGFVEAYDNLLFGLLFLPGLSAADLLGAYADWDQRYGRHLVARQQPHTNDPDPDRRLRIGYVSADYASHPMASVLLPIFENHDHQRFEIICYSNGRKHDAITDRLRACADRWVDVTALGDDELAEQIRTDGIDLLVDLSGHTGGNRLPVFARKPAPLQLTHGVLPSGLAAMDYLISDHTLAPDLPAAACAEQLLRLPRCYVPFAPQLEAPPVGPLPARASGQITFGSFNYLAKVNDQVVALWSRILQAVPNSRLLLKGSLAADPSLHERLRQSFAAEGIDPARIDLRGRTPSIPEHLELYNQVDVCLDPFPFNGFSTTCEALWMGVPVITLAGQLFADRAGATFLNAVGLPELVATTPDEYVAIAVELAADRPRLDHLRTTLRDRTATTLGDGPTYTHDLESAYRQIWQRWCATKLTTNPTPTNPDPLIPRQRSPLDELLSLSKDEVEARPLQLRPLDLDTSPETPPMDNFAPAESAWDEPFDINSIPLLTSLPDLTSAPLAESATELHQAGRLVEAEAAYGRELAADPADSATWSNLGVLLAERQRLPEATQALERALALDPHHPEAHANLGKVRQHQGHLADAEACLLRALELQPKFPDALNNLGNVLLAQSRVEEALGCFQAALEQRPDFLTAHDNFLLALLYVARLEPDVILEAYRSWGELHGKRLARPALPHPNSPEPARRLRVGYVSPDFRQHAIAYAFLPLLEQLDHSQYEIYCYSDVRQADAMTMRLRGLSDVWCEVAGLDDDALAARIRADQIDLLVDLACHTAGNRLSVFARKPAPVQITHSVMTSGLPAIDYLISDETLAPTLPDGAIVESLVRLSRCFTAYAPPDEAPAVTPLPSASSGQITFGSFNNLAKITSDVVIVWSAILKDVPGSRLLLKSSLGTDPATHERLRARFAECGIEPERILFLERTATIAEHLAAYSQVDVGLDPFPFNGCTTTCEALWMGVPVVTMPGQLFADRAGASLLEAVGLTELISTDPEDYVERAVGLANDRALLAEIRAGLRGWMSISPLLDGASYAAEMEEAYREVWRRWCVQQPTALPSL